MSKDWVGGITLTAKCCCEREDVNESRWGLAGTGRREELEPDSQIGEDSQPWMRSVRDNMDTVPPAEREADRQRHRQQLRQVASMRLLGAGESDQNNGLVINRSLEWLACRAMLVLAELEFRHRFSPTPTINSLISSTSSRSYSEKNKYLSCE
jgi:hypothetical protein